MPSLTIELGVSGAEAAQLLTVFGLAGAMAMSLVGRIDPRRLPLIGPAALTIGNALSVFADNFVLLLAVRIVLGVGAAGVLRAGDRGVSGGLAVRTVLGAPIAAVIADQAGCRTVFVLLAVIAAVGAADALLGVVLNPIRRHPIGDPRLLLTAGLKVIFRAAVIAACSLLTPVLAAAAGLHGRVVEVLFVAFGPGAVIGVVAVRRRGAKAALLASTALSAAFVAALPFAHGSVVGVAAALAFWGAAAGAADASMRVLTGDPVVDDVAGFLGVGLAGLIGGAVLTVAGPDALPLVAAAVAVVVLLAAAVGLASNSRREGHRGPGALSTGSQDAR
ncbi:hypothetical protein ACFFG9_41235 [Kutzneria buriramensis]